MMEAFLRERFHSVFKGLSLVLVLPPIQGAFSSFGVFASGNSIAPILPFVKPPPA